MNFYNKSIKCIFLFIFLQFNYAQSQTYSVGVENLNYAPYFYIDSSGNYKGFSNDIFELFMQNTGIKFKFLPMPIFRLYKEFIDGNIDFKFPDSINWQSEMKKNKNIIYSDDVITYIDGIVMKNENKNKNISEIKTIGTIRGFEVKEYKDKNKNIKFLESNNISELIDSLYKDKIDAVFFNIAVALYIVNNNVQYKNKFMFRKDLPYVLDHYKMSTIKNKKLIEDFNNFLKNNNKEIKDLKKKNGIIY